MDQSHVAEKSSHLPPSPKSARSVEQTVRGAETFGVSYPEDVQIRLQGEREARIPHGAEAGVDLSLYPHGRNIQRLRPVLVPRPFAA